MKTVKSPRKPARAYLSRLERPKFWIVAGANGSGKSSVYTDTEFEDTGGAVWIINPDILTARIQVNEQLDLHAANVAAAERMFLWLETSITTYQTIGVETVLSTEKYRPLVLTARDRGFEIRLIYVILKSAALNVARVAGRVRAGGHNVPEDKIIERREKSLRQLPWFPAHADYAWIFDNSTAPTEIARKHQGLISVSQGGLPEIKLAVEAARTIKVGRIGHP